MHRQSARPPDSGADSDEALMERVQRGDSRALDSLFEAYRPRLFGFLVRRCARPEVAEDLLQETWVRVVRARQRFDPRRRFSTWLFQIANNLCRDLHRRNEVEARGHENVRQQLEAHAGADAVPRPAPAPTAAIAKLDAQRQLARLPDQLREVLVLRYYHELSEREIAEVVGIPPGTVKSRLHHAVHTLRAGAKDAD
jgi:RNA polymerase sigma-70 factor (ECF subfamily)